jgi:hypothetical protein
MLRRAADAIRGCQSGDCIILARRALEAAVRTESDLVELLSETPARPNVRRFFESKENGLLRPPLA